MENDNPKTEVVLMLNVGSDLLSVNDTHCTDFHLRLQLFVIEWLNLPDDERPSLIQVYLEEPDLAGHEGGPDSQMVRTAMITVDGITNYFTTRLLEEGLMGCINLVIVSDHGMQTINSSRAVIMEEILPQPFNEALFTGAIAHI
uniref:Ectonucleotide pyrophosphatase/phosphodiesterase family member 6 n=1 Tax=Ascaris lumbricoides TaxID=6252 RepID=A0A0M3HIK4_ASCLU